VVKSSGAVGLAAQTKRPGIGWSHSTPLLTKVNTKVQLLTATFNGAQGLDPTNGEIIWSFRDAKQLGDTVTPTYRDGLVYVDSGRGGMAVALDATGQGDVSKTALKWKIPTLASGFSSPLLAGDYLYRMVGGDAVSCWKWSTGEKVFQERIEGAASALSPFATANGRLYFAGAGKSYVLKAGPKFEVLGTGTLNDPGLASPAVAAGRIYLKGGRFLYCIGAK
jgi:outer membrane protein assembly factor BamB